VVYYNGLTYWPLSFVDNRLGMSIIAYDDNRNIVDRFDRPGARYIFRIDVLPDTRELRFVGQGNIDGDSFVMGWDELTPSAGPQTSEQREYWEPSNHPTFPDNWGPKCVRGPGSGYPCDAYPILTYDGLYYWALTYVLQNEPQSNSLAIVGYGSSGDIHIRVDRKGTQVLAGIRVDAATRTAVFTGQDGNTVQAGWWELKPQPPIP
jgi:hypothetical protein